MNPIFTRYLYDFHLVKYSLQKSLLENKREEALFWAYELYHSGFTEEVWEFVIQLYLQYYSVCSPLFEKRLIKMYNQWKKDLDSCILGTVVGTLAVWNADTHVSSKQFIILYKEDRHQNVPVIYPARNYLKEVSKYSIRLPCSGIVREAYLGPNWLYYCAKTPIWEARIKEHGGRVSEEKYSYDGEVVFETDEDLESFYDKWGFEPDEQSSEIHKMHGIYLN